MCQNLTDLWLRGFKLWSRGRDDNFSAFDLLNMAHQRASLELVGEYIALLLFHFSWRHVSWGHNFLKIPILQNPHKILTSYLVKAGFWENPLLKNPLKNPRLLFKKEVAFLIGFSKVGFAVNYGLINKYFYLIII